MTNPRDLLDAYAARPLPDHLDVVGFEDTAETFAPEAIAALRAVVELHQPKEGQHPDFCWHDKHQMPCPTLRAITVALGGTPDRPRPLPGTARNSIVGTVTGTVIQAGRIDGELRL